MSERSMETFISHLVEPPEFDADEEQLEKNFDKAYYESSKIEILDSVGKDNFKYDWLTLKVDIQSKSIKRQQIFANQYLDKMFEIYDFQFPEKISLNTQYELNNFYLFMEFFEYDNANFISFVWRFLGPKNLLQIDIKKFCERNDNKILRETEEQTEIHPQPKLIALFLRTYYKEKFIEWFIRNSESAKVEITVSLLEREEKR